MIPELFEIKDKKSIPEMCRRFSDFLGYDKPIPEYVLFRAIEEPNFASDLIVCRNSPYFLKVLINDKANIAYIQRSDNNSQTNVELLKRAAGAFMRWGKAGFSTVDEQVLKRREDACLACPNLVSPLSNLQKLIPSKKVNEKIGERTGKKVCRLCGCNVGKKMRLTSESCPDKHPVKKEHNRWGEPISTDS